MGERSKVAEHLRGLIRTANPNAKNVLELGCGTGSMLKRLQDAYEVSGLDVSSKMLSIFQSHAKKSLERNSSSKIWSIFKSTTDST
jgi:ubiquinone/menaquinone biosynthesis C-methylase UbiE